MRATGLKRTTKRLVIRPIQLRDNRAWFAAHCAMLPPKNPWDDKKLPMSALTHQAYCKLLETHRTQLEAGRSITLGIFHREIETLLGHLTLSVPDPAQPENAVLDFRIYNIYWGLGFAKEAVIEALKLSKQLKLKKVELAKASKGKIKL